MSADWQREKLCQSITFMTCLSLLVIPLLVLLLGILIMKPRYFIRLTYAARVESNISSYRSTLQTFNGATPSMRLCRHCGGQIIEKEKGRM